MQKLGLNIRGAKKGAGSIAAGVALIQDYELVVHPDSNNMAKELNNYIYSDKGANLFCDLYNHSLDALRYGVSHLLANRGKVEIR
jgi:phage terminase large subunit